MQLGLYPRLALSVGILLCAALLTLGYLLLGDAERRFRQDRLELAGAQVRTLAEGSLDALVSGDYELLERWVAAVLPADYYAYAYLARVNGQILTHTELGKVGHYVELDAVVSATGTHEIVLDGRRLRELIYPVRVGDRQIANAVIAYYLDEQPFYTRTTAIQIIAVLGLFLALLLAATALIIRRHTRPLSELTEAITTASLSAACVRRPDPDMLKRNDEVGTLAREYNELLDRLQDSYQELSNEEQRLRVMVDIRTRKLQQTNQELESFSYSVSHDLRSPLRAIEGFCRILLEDYADVLDETGKDYLIRVRGASEHMSGLIDDLLRLSRVTRSDLKWQPVNLSELAGDSLAKLMDLQPERTVKINIAPDLVTSGDPDMLSILMDNLIGNALKYTAKMEQPAIEFNTTQADGGPAYYIKDNGVGFDMQYASTLFVPFQRLHKADEFEGTGIGLATAQRIVHRHNGRIWAEARIGEGATIYFTLGGEAADRLQA